MPPDLKLAGSEKISEPDTPRDALDDARWCRLCHAESRFAIETWAKTAHVEQACVDCHDGYHFNPHIAVELDPEVGETDAGSTSEKRRASAWTKCVTCHREESPEVADLRHHVGEKSGEGERPECADCHGQPHGITAASTLDDHGRRERANHRCEGCHGDEARMEAAGLTTHPVHTYEHTMHFKMLTLGSERAPGCVDCHGTHALFDLEQKGAEVCGECHEAATADFVPVADHRPFTLEGRPISFLTLKFFAWLTFLVIFFLALHVLLDVITTLRRAFAANGAADREGAP